MTYTDRQVRPTPSDHATVDHAAELARLEKVARLLDARWRIFGVPFGLDSLIGLVPGVGDTVVLAPSAWMIWRARELGLPRHQIAKMMINTGVDYVVGLVPVLGDLFDLGFKANLRNAAILRAHLTKTAPDA
ncbi:DUF4112 domain-containing protein [Pseudoroseicyclus sp. CXY001]|uniref:DUF4112 domain-containing protein n=1 Tax=Pseudoroseicyclus sp. CXY001 TaxID=3242492 RepID=UPI0035716887